MAKWGTRRERYRRLCMIVLRHRFLYYVMHKPEISDRMYDRLEAQIKRIEKICPKIKHEFSPTNTVGSSDYRSYPRSIRRAFGYECIKKPRPLTFEERDARRERRKEKE